MAVRFYVVPRTGSGTLSDPWRPKYIGDLGGVHWAGMPYGLETTVLTGADVTPAQHSSISANGDVVTVPASLDAQVAGNLAAVRSALQSLKIPGSWIVATNTYREIIGITANAFQFLQRLNGRWRKSVFESGITLSTTFAQLSPAQIAALRDVANSFGIDTSAITGSTTIEEGLFILADQMGTVPIMGELF